jgi:hypothetical protein
MALTWNDDDIRELERELGGGQIVAASAEPEAVGAEALALH